MRAGHLPGALELESAEMAGKLCLGRQGLGHEAQRLHFGSRLQRLAHAGGRRQKQDEQQQGYGAVRCFRAVAEEQDASAL
jgi:hypothetical protein